MSYVELPPGTGAAGCTGCLEVFTSVSAFDKHQRLIPEEQGGGVECRDPASVGLEVKVRMVKGEEWGLWGRPGPDVTPWS